MFQFLMLRRIRLLRPGADFLRLPLVEPFRLSLLTVCQDAACFLLPVCQGDICRTALFGFFCTVLPANGKNAPAKKKKIFLISK